MLNTKKITAAYETGANRLPILEAYVNLINIYGKISLDEKYNKADLAQLEDALTSFNSFDSEIYVSTNEQIKDAGLLYFECFDIINLETERKKIEGHYKNFRKELANSKRKIPT